MFREKKITPFEAKVWLASPKMHGEELAFVKEAYATNWMSTVGKNIDEIEIRMAEKLGCKYGVALASGTAALHMAIRMAGVNVYGNSENAGVLEGKKVFCSDLTFFASINPIVYEGGEPVFIDSERESWNMDPKALEKAFQLYPEVKLIVVVHLYGTPGKMDEIREIADKYDAVIIEDAAESVGASYRGAMTGSFGDYNAISFNGNKIITGSSGGMFLTNRMEDAQRVRKWSTQSREQAPWYQHTEIGYNYRMSNVIAGVVRGQMGYLENHIEAKKVIYEKYRDGLKDIPVMMNPSVADSCPSYWLSCIIIDDGAMGTQVRTDQTVDYVKETGKSCPTEIIETLARFNAEARPIWKPMHLQPIYRNKLFITTENEMGVSTDIFNRGLCLPSDINMTAEQQEKIIDVIKACFE